MNALNTSQNLYRLVRAADYKPRTAKPELYRLIEFNIYEEKR
jgi:hypothetical protein